ncbi:MAG: metal-dependent hydrolase [Gemmatimonadota bacterium]|nr:metal-dependent hydrolase [Gemmatimonadota bacterium]
MQVGHLPLALSIATYDWNPKTVALCVGMHWLPNVDSLVVKAGFAKPEFHCTVTHTVLFAVLVSGVVALISPHYAVFTFVAIVSHYAADIGSTVGLPLFWPVYPKRLTLALFKDTGYWGWDMYIGYYKQPMAWVLEGAVTAFFIYRLFVIGVL